MSFSRILIGMIVIGTSCVDPVTLTLPNPQLPVIIEGLVTDQDEPYRVRVSKAYPVDGKYHSGLVLNNAHVELRSSAGEVDRLYYEGAGVYLSDPAKLKGKIGRTYTLHVRLPDDTTDDLGDSLDYESLPEEIVPSGNVEDIFYEHVQIPNDDKNGILEDELNVFINSTLAPGTTHRIRWQMLGTYFFETHPELITVTIPCPTPPCPVVPLPCSEGCQCCFCWATQQEESPVISNATFLGSDQISRRLVFSIPINNYTFYQKYRMEVTQMEVSQVVYDFYSGIKGQINNATSLFQPPFFALKGNINAVGHQQPVIGIFSAAAVSRKHIYINRSDLPIDLTQEIIPGDCRAVVPNSTTERPPYWQ